MTETAAVDAMQLEVVAEESWEGTLTERTARVLREPEITRDFPDADHWLVGWDVCQKIEGRPFSAIIADSVSGRTTVVEGSLDDPGDTSISYLSHQRPPSDDEFAWAVSRVAETEPESTDQAYRPLPPLANVRAADGTVRRVVAVGLRSAQGRHRIVGVEAGTGDLVPVDFPIEESGGEFGAPPAAEAEGPAAGAHQARVRLYSGGDALWDLVVVRPSASSGTNGSGVELRNVHFAGTLVLERAHLPTVTVAGEGTGPQRLWLDEECGFDAPIAEGASDEVVGFRVGAAAVATVLETGTDGGAFRGVALRLDGTDLVITSQLRAGWYRLVIEWRLSADGSIRPRVGFAPARQPGPGRFLEIEAYWRFDFDIVGPEENTVQEYNDPPVFGTGPWHTLRYEMRRSIEPNRFWRIRHDKSSRTYSIIPPADYPGGSVWVLRHHPYEVDDGEGATAGPERAPVRLDDFVSGEPVHREDLVFWCSTVLHHDPSLAEPATGAGRAGPDLVPRLWTRAAPLAEPALLEPDPT